MAWDPSVLRKYNTTGHFRLLNQLRSELKSNPLVRPKDGERIADVNRSRALVRAIEGAAGSGRSRRGGNRSNSASSAAAAAAALPVTLIETAALSDAQDVEDAGSASFRERLNAVDLR